jgi:hypothetical protein
MHTMLHTSRIFVHSIDITVYNLGRSVLIHSHTGMAHHRILIGLEILRDMCELLPHQLVSTS